MFQYHHVGGFSHRIFKIKYHLSIRLLLTLQEMCQWLAQQFVQLQCHSWCWSFRLSSKGIAHASALQGCSLWLEEVDSYASSPMAPRLLTLLLNGGLGLRQPSMPYCQVLMSPRHLDTTCVLLSRVCCPIIMPSRQRQKNWDTWYGLKQM
jgi:hypothetical protein